MTTLPITYNQNELSSLDDHIRATIESSISSNTARAYKKTLKLFGNNEITEKSVLEFLQMRADQKKSINTIKLDLAALRFKLKINGNSINTISHSVLIQQFMIGLSKMNRSKVKKAKPITAEIMKKIIDTCPSYRDRALILIGWSGALRRSEITAIRVSDLEFSEQGMKLTIRRSKTDQEGAGQTIAIVNELTIEAVIDWIDISGVEDEEYLFQGKLEGKALTDQAVANVIKKYFGKDYSAHGLRSGFMTSAANNGAALHKIVEVSRHKDLRVAQGYITEADKFKGHAGSGLI